MQSIARARPTLTSIWFGEDNSSTIDDASIAAICEHLALERLYIDGNRTLTPGVIDIILGSKTAQTLNDANFFRVDAFTSANILRLARGCPKLVDLCWYVIELDFCGVDAFTSAAGVLRLVRGCPKVIYLYWYASGERILTPLTDGNGQDVDELAELLDSRAPRKGMYEIEVFDEYGPWKADSYHYSHT